MARSAVTSLERFQETYLRLYLRATLTNDSQFPFRPGQNVRTEITETRGEKPILTVVPETLEIDMENTEIELQRSSKEKQVNLEGEVNVSD